MHRGPQARALGVTGAGIDVGIISDSMNLKSPGVAGSQSTGDLPSAVGILQEGPAGGSDEGRAMAEIVFDTAPGIGSMFFHSGMTTGLVGKAQGIASLVSNGADIIVDDIANFGERSSRTGRSRMRSTRPRALALRISLRPATTRARVGRERSSTAPMISTTSETVTRSRRW